MSHHTSAEVVSDALESGVVIFALDTRVVDTPRRRGDVILGYLFDASGGELFNFVALKDIPKTFSQIEEISGGMYYASYIPPISNRRVHDVEVKSASQERLKIAYPRKYVWVE